MFNRVNFMASKEGTATFLVEDAIVEVQDGALEFVIGSDQVYRIKAQSGYGPEKPPVFRVNLSEVPETALKLMEEMIQAGQLEFGIIAAATGSTLILSAFNPSTDSGSYRVGVENDTDGVTSNPATLAQTGSTITITAAPVSQNAVNGTSVTLTVAASGGTLTYQWHFNGAAIDGANDSTYTIPSVTDDTAGSYDVVITNTLTSVTSAAAVISSTPAPVISVQPTDLSIIGGGLVILSATAIGATPHSSDISIQWYRNGVALGMLNPLNHSSSFTEAIVDGLNTITITSNYFRSAETPFRNNDSDVDPTGSYYLKFTDGYGNIVRSDTVTISRSTDAASPATITAQPANQVIITNARGGTGAATNLSVGATSASPMVFQWENGSGSSIIYYGQTFSLTSPATSTQQFYGSGTYECVVFNGRGSIASNVATIKSYWLEFNQVSGTGSYPSISASSGTTQGVALDFHYLDTGGTAPDEPFTITLSQICTDGSTAHGSFSVTSFNSVTHTTGVHYTTPASTYTPSATDVGKTVKIIATLAFSAGPVTGTIGSISATLPVTA